VSELTKDNDPFVRGLCGFCFTENFAEISFKDEAKSLINAVLEDKSAHARNGVAEAVHYCFSDIPLNVALELLEKMANDRHREIRGAVVATIHQNFERIPRQESLRFISRGLEDRAAWVRLEAVGSVRSNFQDMPEELVTKALDCCKELCSYTGWFINFFANITYTHFKEEVQRLKEK
jgi:HEAT repeat protein